MNKEPKIFLMHILESIELIEKYINDISFDDFKADVQLQDSIIRRIEIIGEAAKNLSEDFKEQHLDVNWRSVSGMRDVLIHHYFGVNLDLIWNTLNESLPVLKKQIEDIIK